MLLCGWVLQRLLDITSELQYVTGKTSPSVNKNSCIVLSFVGYDCSRRNEADLWEREGGDEEVESTSIGKCLEHGEWSIRFYSFDVNALPFCSTLYVLSILTYYILLKKCLYHLVEQNIY